MESRAPVLGREDRVSLLREMGEEPVRLEDDFSNVVIADGLPITSKKKFQKLVVFTENLFQKLGDVEDNGVFVPFDENTGQTLGYAFIAFSSPEEAEKVASKGEVPFDKKIMIKLNLWSDVKKYSSIIAEPYSPPVTPDFDTSRNLRYWMLDQRARDQYVLRHSDDTEIYWNDPIKGGREIQYDGTRQKEGGKVWTDLYVRWSPCGSYLASFHGPGVALWGGESFDRIAKFAHDNVQLLSFSPTSRYMLTFNGIDSTDSSKPHCFQFWDVRSARLLRGLEGGTSMKKGTWPIFKWSYDDKYVARVLDESLCVYELPSMQLVGKKSVKITQIQDFEWSPSSNLLAYWTPEMENIPASVSLMSIPEKKVIREKHLFQVHGVKLFWQDQGEFLCVKVAREKKGKFASNNFEIFRMFEKDIPIDVLEIPEKVRAFAWEPNGKRFAYICGESSDTVSCYTMKKTKIKHEFDVKDRPTSNIYWSPAGESLLLASLGQLGGELEFFDAKVKKSMAKQSHHSCTEIAWDPSGRYVSTAVCQPLRSSGSFKFAMNNGYRIWSFIGELVYELPMNDLYQFLWRPRPKSLLTEEQIKSAKAIMKSKYFKHFDEEDEEIRGSQLVGAEKRIADAKSGWKRFRTEVDSKYRQETAQRLALRRKVEEVEWVEVESFVEEEVSVKEEILE